LFDDDVLKGGLLLPLGNLCAYFAYFRSFVSSFSLAVNGGFSEFPYIFCCP